MAFDEIQFPLRANYGSSGGPQFLTEVVTIEGGYERRNQCWSQARRRFDARTGVMTARDGSILSAFFQARGGRARGFRLKDWTDYSSALDGTSDPRWDDQTIGTGDASTTRFQLRKVYGSAGIYAAREITKPVAGSVRVGVDASEYQTGWSVDTTRGVVSFTQAPTSGAAIKAGFLFDVPVRFDTDRLTITADDARLAETEIPLIEVRTP